MRLYNVILASNEKMLRAVARRARQLRLNALILSSKLEGESSEAGRVFGSIAAEVEANRRPAKPPLVLIAGGETTVRIDQDVVQGTGGPSQEFALGAALEISHTKRISVSSLDTDGSDGPTEAAGGIVDSLTLARSERLNEDIVSNLRKHSSFELLRKLNDQIVTDVAGTNVMDLDLAVILS
jgi:glycerate 2-kinase